MPDPLDAVPLWIISSGIAHVMTSAEPLRAQCGRDTWKKAAVIKSMFRTSTTTGKITCVIPRRICAECRRLFTGYPTRRPRLQDVQPAVERQLAFGGDWGDEP
jgi:hypothetical protein